MNVDLKHLIRLQSVDRAILDLQAKVDQFQGISKALDAKLAHATAALDAARDKAKTSQADKKKFESEVTVLEGKISKYREQMLSVKTNAEYKALQTEIEHAQAGIRGVEDKILVIMMDAENSQGEIKAAEARLKEDQQRVQAERKELEAEHHRELAALESYAKERSEIQTSVSADLLARYDRVRKFRDGIGLSPARDSVCEVCQVRIRPQVFQEIRKNDKIIACDACQRILYDPENLDHPFEVA